MDDIIDYAQHMMKIERLLKATHDACLDKDYETAMNLTPEIIVEARALRVAIIAENEKL